MNFLEDVDCYLFYEFEIEKIGEKTNQSSLVNCTFLHPETTKASGKMNGHHLEGMSETEIKDSILLALFEMPTSYRLVGRDIFQVSKITDYYPYIIKILKSMEIKDLIKFKPERSGDGDPAILIGNKGFEIIEDYGTYSEYLKIQKGKTEADDKQEIVQKTTATPEAKSIVTDNEIYQGKTNNTKELRDQLKEHGFFDHLANQELSEKAQEEILQLIAKNDLPYRIALLQELSFVEYVKREYCKNNTQRDHLLAKILNNVSHRKVKGNINVLNPKSGEDRNTYTSRQHLDDVKNDLQRARQK